MKVRNFFYIYIKDDKVAKDNQFSFVTNVAKLEEVTDTTFEASSEFFLIFLILTI